MTENQFTAATITLSDKAAKGERQDSSGKLLRELLEEMGAALLPHEVLADEEAALRTRLIELTEQADLVITTGGTGISPRDRTPEATAAVVMRRLPGVEAALHFAGREKVPTSILSRGVVGVRGNCLIVNLPGSPGGVRDGMSVLKGVLKHALKVLKGEVRDCKTDLSQGSQNPAD
jgi:molybdenum cofactor synthesis domain-containing protein